MKTILLTVALTLMFMPSISDAAKPIKNLVGVPVSVEMDGTSHSLVDMITVYRHRSRS